MLASFLIAIFIAAPSPTAAVEIRDVRFATTSPFSLADAPEAPGERRAVARLYLPEDASAAEPVPAVVMLHGAGGVMSTREHRYAREFAERGHAALVIDVFAARRDIAGGFVERILNITESMFLADAYAALDWLAGQPAVDASRIALVGFSYGGMASLYAAHEQAAERFGEHRFAAHVAYYAPCIADFSAGQTTGAPVLMLAGALDELIDRERCEMTADSLRQGGSSTDFVLFDDAYHQWDGRASRPRRMSRGLASCHLRVDDRGVPRDERTGLAMTSYWQRAIILGLCSDQDGYLIKADEDVRSRAKALMDTFLSDAFERRSPS